MPLSATTASTTPNIYALSDALTPAQTLLTLLLALALALVVVGMTLIFYKPSRTVQP